ncbi:MAG: hypothetical protein ACLGIR_08750 [Actinomycetes bacterium]
MRRVLALLLVPAAALSVAASSADGFGPREGDVCRVLSGGDGVVGTDDDITLCTVKGFAASTNPAKADNLAVTGAVDFPTWVREAPAQSVAAGAGNGYVGQWETSLLEGNPDATNGVRYEGTFDGALESIAVDQYLFAASASAFAEYGVIAVLEIDGMEVYRTDFVEGDLVPSVSGGSAVQIAKMAFTGLLPFTVDGGEHDIAITVTPYFIGDDSVYVWGTTEAPTSITFNPGNLSGYGLLGS